MSFSQAKNIKPTHLTPLLASWEENMLAFFNFFMSQNSKIGEFFSQEITSMRFFETNSHEFFFN